MNRRDPQHPSSSPAPTPGSAPAPGKAPAPRSLESSGNRDNAAGSGNPAAGSVARPSGPQGSAAGRAGRRPGQAAPESEPTRGPAPAQNPSGDAHEACEPKPTDWADGDDAQHDHKPPCPEGYDDRQPQPPKPR
jgi:hypothetical protein